MFGESSETPGTVTEGPPPVEQAALQKEYGRCVQTLSRVGAVSLLPRTESLGVVGFDGKEYPLPTPSEVSDIFDQNKELVDKKRRQGFTRLQLTPLATPLAVLKDRAQSAVLRHAKEGKIFQAKRDPAEPDIAVSVNTEDPLYMWDQYIPSEQNGQLVYLPKSFSTRHEGVTKPEVVERSDICAVPGWSVTLVEDTPFLPRQGSGIVKRERKQPENNQTPNDYLRAYSDPEYKGESGLTPEDFLIKFMTHLEETNQVSNDWDDHSGAWLTGAYFPNEGYVPYGYWYRDYRQLYLDGLDPDYRFDYWGAPSTVRLAKLDI